jgi:hypothetical protein
LSSASFSTSLASGFFCWVLFTLAIYALPFFIGLTAGMYAHQAGTGPLGTIALGLVAGAFAVVLGQLVFSTVRALILRITIALFFAAPAALAGYHATYGLSGLTTSSDLVREVFAVIGAIVTGATAWTRLAASLTAVSAGPEDRRCRNLLPRSDQSDVATPVLSSLDRSKSHARCAS